MEPNVMPGNTSFIAGFAQCVFVLFCFYIHSYSNVHGPNFKSQCRRHKSKYVNLFFLVLYSNLPYTYSFRLGAFCESPGQPHDGQLCDTDHSTCGGKVQDCHGRWIFDTKCTYIPDLTWFTCRGPGFHVSDFESNRIIGEAQFLGAQKVMSGHMSPVKGAVKSVHTYLNMHVLSISYNADVLLLTITLCSCIAGLTIPLLFRTEPQCPHVLLPWVSWLVIFAKDQTTGWLTNRLFP